MVGTKLYEGKIQEIDPCPGNHSIIYTLQQLHYQCGLHDIHQSPETKEMPKNQFCVHFYLRFRGRKKNGYVLMLSSKDVSR